MSILELHSNLKRVIGSLDKPLGDLQYLLSQIDQEIEGLQEMRGEVYERMDNVARAIDLNHKIKENHAERDN